MSVPPRSVFRPVLCLAAFVPLVALAGTTSPTWIGGTDDNSLASNANWSAPLAGDGSDSVVFGHVADPANYNLLIPGNLAVAHLTFNGTNRGNYQFDAPGPAQLTVTGGITVETPGDIAFGSSNLELSFNSAATAHAIDITAGTTFSLLGPIGIASGSLTKQGAGTLQLNDATARFADGTSLLVKAGTLALRDGSLTFAGSGGATVQAGATLAGNGQVDNLSLAADGTLSAGLAQAGLRVGSLTFGDLTLAGGSTLALDVQSGQNGVLSDYIAVQNSQGLTINASIGNPLTLRLVSLSADGQSGAMAGLRAGHTYTLNFLSNAAASGSLVLGENLVLDLALFNSGFTENQFQLLDQNGQYALAFTPVPEPSTYALLAFGMGLLICVWRRVADSASVTNASAARRGVFLQSHCRNAPGASCFQPIA